MPGGLPGALLTRFARAFFPGRASGAATGDVHGRRVDRGSQPSTPALWRAPESLLFPLASMIAACSATGSSHGQRAHRLLREAGQQATGGAPELERGVAGGIRDDERGPGVAA